MTPAERQKAFNRFFAELARSCSEKLRVGYAGTIRKLPPPPLPGETHGRTRYYFNAIAADGSGSRLVELGGAADRALRRAEQWAATGNGLAPGAKPRRILKLKRKV
jgi:hypothetical protein